MGKMITRAEILQALQSVLREIQLASGHGDPIQIDGALKPVQGDLAGFDSLLAVEATVAIEARLNVSIKSDNVFVNQSGRALTVNQSVLEIERLLALPRGLQ